jgi:hypothetical protein
LDEANECDSADFDPFMVMVVHSNKLREGEKTLDAEAIAH